MNAAPSSRSGFHVWVRRQDAGDCPFALRFEVLGGRGILRVARPGVLIDPPARPVGTEERLTGLQLRQSRFLHVRENGRERIGYSLARLEDGALERLPAGQWVELTQVQVGTSRFLGVPDAPAEDAMDHPTNPARALIDDLSRDLRHLVERARPVAVDDHELLEADAVTGEEPYPEDLLAAAAAEEDGEDVHDDITGVGEVAPAADDASARRAGIVWSHAPVQYDAGAFDVEAYEEVPDEEPTNPGTLTPLGAVALVPERPAPDPVIGLHPRLTTLVRFFRRRIARDAERIRALEARVAYLESRLREPPTRR